MYSLNKESFLWNSNDGLQNIVLNLLHFIEFSINVQRIMFFNSNIFSDFLHHLEVRHKSFQELNNLQLTVNDE